MRLDLGGFAAVSAFLLLACGYQPMPLVVAQGTTFTIVVATGFGPGFGRVITGNPAPGPAFDPGDTIKEDLQRGELIFQLVPFGVAPNIDTTPAGQFLPRELVTRIRVDNTAQDSFGNDLFPEGQAVAVLKMPLSVLPDQYEIYVWRFRRDDATAAGDFVRVDTQWKVFTTGDDGGPWTGWGQVSPDRGIPITVVAAGDCDFGGGVQNECFTSHIGWARGGVWAITGAYSEADLKEITPYPALQIESSLSSSQDFGAWDVTVDYPLEKLEIKGVAAYGNRSSQSIVLWRVDTPAPQTFNCTSGSTDRLHVQVVSPEQDVRRILVAFELRPDHFITTGQGGCAAGGRAALDDFIVDVTGYDLNGEEVSSAGFELYDDYML